AVPAPATIATPPPPGHQARRARAQAAPPAPAARRSAHARRTAAPPARHTGGAPRSPALLPIRDPATARHRLRTPAARPTLPRPAASARPARPGTGPPAARPLDRTCSAARPAAGQAAAPGGPRTGAGTG